MFTIFPYSNTHSVVYRFDDDGDNNNNIQAFKYYYDRFELKSIVHRWRIENGFLGFGFIPIKRYINTLLKRSIAHDRPAAFQ